MSGRQASGKQDHRQKHLKVGFAIPSVCVITALATTALRWGHVVRYTPFAYILCRVPPTAAIM
jgi:hypothetical protein